MNVLNTYSIPYKSLRDGKHSFSFQAGKAFFDACEGSDIRDGKVDIDVDIDKASSMLALDFSIRGHVVVPCDRCLEDCNLPVDYNGRLTVRFSETENYYDGEVMWMNPGDDTLELAQYIYESIVLSLPVSKVHPDDENGQPTCDPQMLSHFKIVTPEEFDRMTQPAGNRLAETEQGHKLAELKEKLK